MTHGRPNFLTIIHVTCSCDIKSSILFHAPSVAKTALLNGAYKAYRAYMYALFSKKGVYVYAV